MMSGLGLAIITWLAPPGKLIYVIL